MTIEETRQTILESDEFVLAEFKKLQTLFLMKQVIRYHHTREEVVDTESVAEHVYGMFVIAEYFLPLEDTEEEWDQNAIRRMIIFHDIDEIETGDTIGYLKTATDREQEFVAQQRVIDKIPPSLQNPVTEALSEYETRESREARFVKAVDKLEPIFHLFNHNGKQILAGNQTTLEQHQSIKDPYMTDFPYLKRFNEVMTDTMQKEQFFAD